MEPLCNPHHRSSGFVFAFPQHQADVFEEG